MQQQRSLLLWLILALAFGAGCNEESTRPQDDDNELILPALTSPASIVSALEILYNEDHSDSDRLAGYATLLDSSFVFHFQANDIGLPQSWGREDELAAHAGMFGAQSGGDIYMLELRITHDSAEDLSPPEVGREGWQEIFATNVYLRLMFNPEDGLEVNGGQAEFKFPPAKDGLFKLADWTDLPRPGALRSTSVDPSTWGGIKAMFN